MRQARDLDNLLLPSSGKSRQLVAGIFNKLSRSMTLRLCVELVSFAPVTADHPDIAKFEGVCPKLAKQSRAGGWPFCALTYGSSNLTSSDSDSGIYFMLSSLY